MIQSAARFYTDPATRYRDLGFRTVTPALPGESAPLLTNALPVVIISLAPYQGTNGWILTWLGYTGEVYSVERAMSMTTGFSMLATNILNLPVNVYTDVVNTASGMMLYRVRRE